MMEMLELAAELKWCRERITALEAERDQLRAELAECKQDAERYREVRKRIVEGTMPEIPIYEELTESKIDAVLDATLAGEGENNDGNA